MKLVVTSLLFASGLLIASTARAELLHVELKTLGMDWEICAHAVRVAMQKVDGVQTVRVSLNDGLTILDLKPGNAVMMAKLRQIIKNNGFVSKEATVIARGEPKGHQAFVVDGTNEQIAISGTPQKVADNWRFTVAAPNP